MIAGIGFHHEFALSPLNYSWETMEQLEYESAIERFNQEAIRDYVEMKYARPKVN